MQENTTAAPRKAGIGAYIALIFAVIFFSGISVSKPAREFGTVIAAKLDVEPKKVHDVLSVFDFGTLNGEFGKVLLCLPKRTNRARTPANFPAQTVLARATASCLP